MLEGRDEIKDLFSEKLNGFESEVRPEMWSKISSQLGTTATVTTGISVALKVVIASTVAASIAGAVYLIRSNSEKPIHKEPRTQNIEKIEQEINSNSVKKEDNNSFEEAIRTDNFQDQTFKTVICEGTVQSCFPIIPMPVLVKDESLVLPNNEENKKETTVTDKELIAENKEEKKVDPVIEEFKKEETPADYTLELPNVFTPNGDGTNDFLSIRSEKLTDLNIVILDKNNKVVYSTDQADFQWNGTNMTGDTIPSGNYVYYVTGRDLNGKLISKYSLLTIAR